MYKLAEKRRTEKGKTLLIMQERLDSEGKYKKMNEEDCEKDS